MSISAKPLGKIYSNDIESDIVELSYSLAGGLRIIIDTGTGKFTPVVLEVLFGDTRGFRCLDEGDLIRYWESNAFIDRYHVYEISSGGWISGETLDYGLLSVSSSVGQKEWFVVTTNFCVSVIGVSNPLMRELSRA